MIGGNGCCPGKKGKGNGYTGFNYMNNNIDPHPPIILSQDINDIFDNTKGRTTFSELYYNGIRNPQSNKHILKNSNTKSFKSPNNLKFNYKIIPINHGWYWPAMKEFLTKTLEFMPAK